MIKSCGIVPIRFVDGKPKYLLLNNHSHWDFPKGKMEDGEDEVGCALRELEEESGLKGPTFDWGMSAHETEPYSKPRKTAKYFVAKVAEDAEVKLLPNPDTGLVEHQEYKWLDFDQAKQLLKPRILRVLEFAAQTIEEKK